MGYDQLRINFGKAAPVEATPLAERHAAFVRGFERTGALNEALNEVEVPMIAAKVAEEEAAHAESTDSQTLES